MIRRSPFFLCTFAICPISSRAGWETSRSSYDADHLVGGFPRVLHRGHAGHRLPRGTPGSACRRFRHGAGILRAVVAGVRIRGDNRLRGDLPWRSGPCLRVRDADDLGQFPVSHRRLLRRVDLHAVDRDVGQPVRQPFHTGVPRRPLSVQRHPGDRLGVFAGPVLLHRRPTRVRIGDVRGHAGDGSPVGLAGHLRGAGHLRVHGRRPRRHPDRRCSGDHDARAGGGGDRPVRVRCRRGRQHAGCVRQPREAGRQPRWAPEHHDPPVSLLVVHRLHCRGAPSARAAAAPRQQAVGVEGNRPAALVHQAGFRLRDHAGHAGARRACWPGRCSATRWTTRTRPCRCSSSSCSRPGSRR